MLLSGQGLDSFPVHGLGQAHGVAAGLHQRNAKLQLTVLLAPPEAVPGLYLHPDHRRRRLRPPVRSELDV
jgi:hypothetical protein